VLSVDFLPKKKCTHHVRITELIAKQALYHLKVCSSERSFLLSGGSQVFFGGGLAFLVLVSPDVQRACKYNRAFYVRARAFPNSQASDRLLHASPICLR